MITFAYIAPNGRMFHMSYPHARDVLVSTRALAQMPDVQPIGVHFPDLDSLRDYTDQVAIHEPFDEAAVRYAAARPDRAPGFGFTPHGVRAWWWDELSVRGCIYPDDCPVPCCTGQGDIDTERG